MKSSTIARIFNLLKISLKNLILKFLFHKDQIYVIKCHRNIIIMESLPHVIWKVGNVKDFFL